MLPATQKLPLSGLTFPEMVPIPPSLGPSSVLNIFGLWNVTTDEEKLEFIYTQRWLDAFRQPWEAYALVRRTGMTPREGGGYQSFQNALSDLLKLNIILQIVQRQ